MKSLKNHLKHYIYQRQFVTYDEAIQAGRSYLPQPKIETIGRKLREIVAQIPKPNADKKIIAMKKGDGSNAVTIGYAVKRLYFYKELQ